MRSGIILHHIGNQLHMLQFWISIQIQFRNFLPNLVVASQFFLAFLQIELVHYQEQLQDVIFCNFPTHFLTLTSDTHLPGISGSFR